MIEINIDSDYKMQVDYFQTEPMVTSVARQQEHLLHTYSGTSNILASSVMCDHKEVLC